MQDLDGDPGGIHSLYVDGAAQHRLPAGGVNLGKVPVSALRISDRLHVSLAAISQLRVHRAGTPCSRLRGREDLVVYTANAITIHSGDIGVTNVS